LVRSGLHRFR